MCAWSSYLKRSAIKIINVAVLSQHMLSTRLMAGLSSILRMVPERNVAMKKNPIPEPTKKKKKPNPNGALKTVSSK